MMRVSAILAAAAIFALPLSGAWAAKGEITIAAIVNDDVITSEDLTARLKLTVLMSGLEDRPEMHPRLAAQLLRRLIDETLQVQEAKARRFTVSDEEIHAAYAHFAKRQGKSVDELTAWLGEHGIEPGMVEKQIEAEALWNKYLFKRLKPKINITDQEIKEAIEAASGGSGFDEWQVQIITLPVDSPQRADAAEALARDLMKEVKEGAPFENIAAQFPDASIPSDKEESTPWLNAAQLDKAVLETLEKMAEPGIAGPIRSPAGFHIIKLLNKRRMMDADPEDTEVALRQIILPLAEDAPEEEISERMAQAVSMKEKITGCGDFLDVGAGVEGANAHNLGRLQLRDVQGDVRDIIAGLPVGEASDAFRTPVGVHLMIVCQRIEPRSVPIHEEQVRQIITQKKLSLEAIKTIRDLRRRAFLDVRL